MKKLNVQSPRPSKASKDSKAKRTFEIPHPLQDLTGVCLRTKPIPESMYDYVIERDARIFERLAKI